MEGLRILLVSLEYADPIFSGNGVLARNLAKSLVALGVVDVAAAADLVRTPGSRVERCANTRPCWWSVRVWGPQHVGRELCGDIC